MTDEKNPADRAIELFVFAPLGLALSARELLPELVERGRQQVSGQVSMARMIGQFAVKQGTIEAEKAFERARASAQSTLEQLGVLPDEAAARPSATAAPTTSATGTAPGTPATVTPATATPPPSPAPTGGAGAASAATPVAATTADAGAGEPAPELAIPDYDSLSASQVLPRLSGLSPSELEAVRAHEATHRGRKTILSKVAQLQAS